jgi:hypothetical protein
MPIWIDGEDPELTIARRPVVRRAWLIPEHRLCAVRLALRMHTAPNTHCGRGISICGTTPILFNAQPYSDLGSSLLLINFYVASRGWCASAITNARSRGTAMAFCHCAISDFSRTGSMFPPETTQTIFDPGLTSAFPLTSAATDAATAPSARILRQKRSSRIASAI